MQEVEFKIDILRGQKTLLQWIENMFQFFDKDPMIA
jgi:hypothetical protein